MASVSSLGIGAGLDLQKILTSIMSAERAPINLLDSRLSSTNSKISVYGTLNSKLDALKSAAETLEYPSRLSAVKGSSSDASVVTVTAAFTATKGTYSTQVTQLASAQKSFSQAYSSGTTFDAGEVQFTVAGELKSPITVNAGATLSEVSASINSAKLGVTATVVTASDGQQRMILTGEKTGTGNGFTLTSTATALGGQASLADFDEQSEADIALNGPDGLMRSIAQDALMKIDGIEVRSSTNSFTGAVAGLNLTATKIGSSTVSVQDDKEKITSALKAFVDAFNSVATTIKTNSGYDTATKTGQALSGDSAVRSVSSLLNSARTNIPTELSTANLKSFSDIGITIQQTGQLSIDSAKLDAAISNSPKELSNLLVAYGKTFSSSVQNMQSTGGVVANRMESLKNAVTRINANKEAMEARMVLIEKRYRTQFTSLDKYVSSMQTTSSYLGQQISQMFSSSS